jgi:hypothetical protein
MLEEWIAKAENPRSLEIVLVVDANNPPTIEVGKSLAAQPWPNECAFHLYVQDQEPFCCVKGWNLAAEKSTGKVLVQITDDFSPPPGWDRKLLELPPANWIEGEHALHVDDGYVRDLMTLAIITRKRYEKFGYLFYPDYLSIFCDTELTEVAYLDGVVINAKHLLFEHKHPDCHKRERDEVDKVHASQERWKLGEMLFNWRKSKNFPVDVGPNAGKVKVGRSGDGFCVYIQATKDDFCLKEVCQRMMEEGVKDFFFSVPDEYWSGRPTPKEDIDEVIAIANWVCQNGGRGLVNVHRVKTYRFPGDSRIRVETRVRNDALAWIRKHRFQHILIVDGDELWKRGTLSIVKAVIQKHRPTAISTFMVPVIGLPGYPVDGATDVAVVYIDSRVEFKECRTPIGEQFRVHMPLVYHFTGTRRTMEATARKHRDSGHYDDPDYDFEEFIVNVLPKIQPGYQHDWGTHKGLHFYKKYQIWPAVRNWWPADAQEIPQTLWSFLAIQQPQPA